MPTLTSSGFTDPDVGDTHAASRWQITVTSGNYSSPVFDSLTDTSNLTSIVVPSAQLSYSTTYYWHVSYQDNHDDWSTWSSETSFATASPTLSAGFSANVTELMVGQSVQFTDRSTGVITSWRWDFGDGSIPVTWIFRPQDGKISHTYTAAGTYTVSLKVTDSSGSSDTETRTGYITVYPSPQAGFSASATGILLGEAIAFTNLSTGGIPPLTYAWDFDSNGVVESRNQNPMYSYAAAGTYSGTLRVADSGGGNSATEMKTGYIVVGNAIAPHSVPPQGGTIQTADGQIATTFPANAFSGEATVVILEMSPSIAPKTPKGYSIGSLCFALEVTDARGIAITSFSRPVTVTVRYADEGMAAAGDARENLVLAYYDEALGKWTFLDTAFDGTNKSLSATTTRFSTWAILVKTSSDMPTSWIQIVIGVVATLVAGIVVWKSISLRESKQVP
jgi:PKD repeat protein